MSQNLASAQAPAQPGDAEPTSQRGLYRSEYEHDACGIGAIAHLKGKRSHQTLDDALSVLVNLEHRGGTGLERNTGDGAGVLFQIPHRFFRKEAQKEGQLLPDEGDYGVAMLFFPHDDPQGVADARRVFEEGCAAAGVSLMFWREVPVDPHDLGSTAQACMPTILQAFLRRPESTPRGQDFERKLYVCRRTIERMADANPALAGKIFYVCSMSSRTIVYKGMLVATQMRRFFTDLNDAAVETSWPWCTPATPPTPRPAGSALTPTATSSTTERSTPCAATFRGFALASRTSTALSSAMTSRRSFPSSTRRARTPPSWTTFWSF